MIAVKVNRLLMVKRFVAVLMLFGSFFKDFVALRIKKKVRRRRVTESDYRAVYTSQAKRFRKKADQLGGLLIKLGQFISVHVDVLPEEYTKELSDLQDAASAASFSEIEGIIAAELGATGLTLQKEPLASASLGQVHKAILPDGNVVAVKVLKPNIDRLVSTDLLALRWVTEAARRYTRWGREYDLLSIFKEFEHTTKRELDLKGEGQNAQRLAQELVVFDDVLVPKIYWDFTSRRVLTMEYMEGVKVNEYNTLSSWEIDRNKLSGRLFEVFWHQVMETEFFHADPHPGNILVNSKGQLILLDFGMVSSISAGQKQEFFQLMAALIASDSRQFSLALEKLGFVRAGVERGQLEEAMEFLLNAVKDMGEGQEMAEEVRGFLYSQPFQLPANVLFLGKTFSTLMGVCYGLDNDFNFMKSVTESLGIGGSENKNAGFTWGKEAFNLKAVLIRLREFYDIPRHVVGLEKELRSLGENQTDQLANLQKLLNGIIWAILAVGSGLIAAILHAADKPGAEMGWMAMLLFGGILFISLFAKRPPKRINRRRIARHKEEDNAPPPGFAKPKFHP